MIYALLALLCFAFNWAHFYIGAELSVAEKNLHPIRAAHWAALGDAVAQLDYVIFAAIAIHDQSVWRASAVAFLPSIAGAWIGERQSVRANWVSERVKRAKRAAAKLTSEGANEAQQDEVTD